MKKDSFILEFLTSFPIKVLIILLIFILTGVAISKCKEKKVEQMKEDVLYIQPKPKV
jgi:uncharacterized membrane protein